MKKHVVLIALGLTLTAGCNAGPGAPSVASSSGALEQAMEGKGELIDLTHKLNQRIPFWPGANYKPFRFETIATMEKDGVYSGFFAMPEHMGTHIDAPNHFERGQVSVDAIPLRRLISPAAVIDVRDQAAQDADYRLTLEEIRSWESENGTLPAGALLFMYTGWDSRWNSSGAYRNQNRGDEVMHFPGFSVEAAEFLVKERDIHGIGIDTRSVDYGPSEDFPVHHITNGAGKYHIENAANLDKLPAKGAIVMVAPISIEGGSGGPARVFAFVTGGS